MRIVLMTVVTALLQAAPPTSLDHAKITRWGLADGLPEESIASIFESSDGYVWLATREGLVRFDGRSFRTFSPGEGSGLFDHGLGAIAADENILWAAGRDYIGYAVADAFRSFTRLRFQATHFPRVKGDRYGVAGIRRCPDGWVLWRSDGVYTIPDLPVGGVVTPELILSPPGGERLLAFHEGPSGRRWIVTASGLKVWEEGRWRPVQPTPTTPSILIEARDGTLWIYSHSQVEHITPGRRKQYPFEPAYVGAPLKGLLEDQEGAVWVGAPGYVARIRDGRIERLRLNQQIRPDDLVQAIHQSRDGAIWLGTRTGVLLRVEAPVFNPIGPDDGVTGSSVSAVQQDRQGRVWIGTRTAGVFVQDGSRWREVQGTRGRVHMAMTALPDGRVAGADSEGLWVGDAGRIRRILRKTDHSLGSFRSLSADYGDHLYFSDSSGIYRLGLPLTSTPVKIADVPSVRNLVETKDGLWAMSWDRGLVHVGPNTTTEYPLDAHRARRGMTVMELTPRLLLVGTNNGVFAFDRDSRAFVPGRVFEPSEQIFFIQPDHSGNLWFAGRRSLLSAGRDTVIAFFEGRGHSVVPTRFTVSQGLASTNFGLGTSSVATLAADGQVWLASQQGAIHFRPSAVIFNSVGVRCAVEAIRADGTPVPLDGDVRIRPGTRRIQIQYTVLARKAGENPVFRYRLAGDTDWVESTDFEAAFTNLEPGRHRFELQARVASLRWPPAVAALDFHVTPYWHQRPEVRLVGMLALVLAGMLAVRVRGARIRRQTALLEEKVRLRTEELAKARDQAEQLRERAEAAVRAKSEFLANMSHEIRTPLNGVIGMTELALQSELTEIQREYLNIAKISADALLTVINDILDFSKIDAGKMQLAPTRFSVRQAAADVFRMVEMPARAKGLELSLSVAPQVPPELHGDVGRLRQVMLNLLTNAVKFTDQGLVSLSVDVERLAGRDVLLHFAVRDTGIGIPSDMHERIFQAFEQADGSITRRYGGTGLGLTISSRLVGMMKGRLWLESQPGSGSTFHFTVWLELAEVQEGDGGEVPETGAAGWTGGGGTPARILLAEDNGVNELVAVRVLERKGYKVTVARTGLEALGAWEQHRFYLLLMDVQMPVMDGIETAVEIRKRENGGSRVPIIALTAGAFAEDRERCLEAGMNDFVAKPIIARELFTTIRRWLPGSEVPGDGTVVAPHPGTCVER